MAGTDTDTDTDKEAVGLIPSWQQAASTAPPPDSGSPTAPSDGSTLEQARRFLQNDAVRVSSREDKIEFLKTKGIGEDDTEKMLAEVEATTPQATAITTTTAAAAAAAQEDERAVVSHASKGAVAPAPAPEPPQQHETAPTNHPPIITYPEFLTQPAKPPPLVTPGGLLNSLGLVAGLSTLVYGATRYLVSPMVESLTDARADLHDTANRNVSRLVEQLEHAVSEIPPSYHHHHGHGHGHGHSHSHSHSHHHGHDTGKRSLEAHRTATADDDDDDDDDSGSSYDDPSELFHRDIGVQTSAPPSPDPSAASSTSSSSGPFGTGNTSYPQYSGDNNNINNTTTTTNNNKPGSGTQQHADKLRSIISSVRGLDSDLGTQVSGLSDARDALDRLSRDLYSLAYPPDTFGGASYIYGTARAEPDDQVRTVKNSIRGVKGVLLSTRSFPAGTR